MDETYEEEDIRFQGNEQSIDISHQTLQINSDRVTSFFSKFPKIRNILMISFSIGFLLILAKVSKISLDERRKVYLKSLTLSSLCESTAWQKDLYINCTNIDGNAQGNGPRPQGVSNVKSMIVTCLRWAIDGGMGFIVPRIALRSKDNLKSFDEWGDISYFFDRSHLNEVLHKECPQLPIYESDHNVGVMLRSKYEVVPPNFYFTHGEYRSHVKDLLYNAKISPMSQHSVSILENDVVFGWDFANDSPQVHASLLNAVQFNSYLRTLGEQLTAMIGGDYIGVHLRAESDWTITNYRDEVGFFLRTLEDKSINLTTVYVAVGTKELEDQFRNEMKALNRTVISKWTVASKNQIVSDELNQLGFDQVAVIDQYVLTNSAYFFGIGLSSYSYLIAWERGKGDISKCNCELCIAIQPAFKCCY